jgi:hypothetical protein
MLLPLQNRCKSPSKKQKKKKKKTKKKKALVQYSFTIELKEKIEAHLLEGAQKTRQQN